METSSSNALPNLSSDLAKLFIGGIKESLKEDAIRDHFGKFGEVKDVVVVKDRVSGDVRGFGFVEFSDPDSAERALIEEHVIGERKVEVKRARPRAEQRRNYQSSPYQFVTFSQHENRGLNNNSANNYDNSENPTKLKKIFVGGLPSSISVEEFKSYFEQFGRTNDVVIMYDSSTHRPRGFGFITFDKVESVNAVLQKQYHELSSKRVEVKLAVPKDSNNHNNFSDFNGVNYNSSIGGGRGPAVDNRQVGFYPPSSPRFGLYSGYGPAPFPAFYYGTGGYGGGYFFGAYGGLGYSPYPSARAPWSGPGMAARRSPFPYGNAYGYMTTGMGSYMGMTAGDGYRGYGWYADDKSNQTGTDVRITEEGTGAEDVGSEKLEVQQEY